MVIPDCGKCKNCKDKKKFGGSGIKKKACCKKENKKADSLNTLSNLATMLIKIHNYNDNINISSFDSLLMLTNIIDFDQNFIKNI